VTPPWVNVEAPVSRNVGTVASDVMDGRMNLMATVCPRSRWVAATTMPIPPWPRTASTRYLSPTTVPGFM